jgi:hypothetical protein
MIVRLIVVVALLIVVAIAFAAHRLDVRAAYVDGMNAGLDECRAIFMRKQ